MKPLIIYHKGCLDGITAALVTAYGIYDKIPLELRPPSAIDSVEFLPAKYGDSVPDIRGREVYIVDFSYPPENLVPASAYAKEIVIIDHHKTAIDKWSSFQYYSENITTIFDLTCSGAGLAWIHFNGILKDTPAYVRLAEDYDLYNFTYEDTKPYVAAVMADGCVQNSDIASFEYLINDSFIDDLVHDGNILLKARDSIIQELVKNNTKEIVLDEHRVLICNCPQNFRDEVGEMLCKDRPFSITYDDALATNIRKFSLRSNKEYGIDVAKIAERYNGGGHRNAAAFTTMKLGFSFISGFMC